MNELWQKIVSFFEKLGGTDIDFAVVAIAVVLLVLIAILLFLGNKVEQHKKDLLIEHLSDEIRPNDFYEHELNDCYIELAIRIFEWHRKAIYTRDGEYTHAFLECKDEIRSKFKPKVTTQFVKRFSVFSPGVVLYFSDEFREWIECNYSDATVNDFYDVLLSYFDYLLDNDEIDIGIVLIENQVMTLEEDDLDTECDAPDMSEEIDEIVDDTKNDILKMQHKVYVDAYNEQIQIIKANSGRGLLPVHTNHISSEFNKYLSTRKVYSQQKFLSECESLTPDSEETGCYIIYNTYTGKYFVGKSNTPMLKAYSFLTGSTPSNSLLPHEFSTGHMVLVKVVPVVDSGYVSASALQKALVKCYHSMYPFGYNQVPNKT